MDRKRAAAAPAIVAAEGTTSVATDAGKEDSVASYSEERERFDKDLRRFHDARGWVGELVVVEVAHSVCDSVVVTLCGELDGVTASRLCMWVYVCGDGCRTPITRWPSIGAGQLDLYTLYTSVIKLGGWEKVRCNTVYRPSTPWWLIITTSEWIFNRCCSFHSIEAIELSSQ